MQLQGFTDRQLICHGRGNLLHSKARIRIDLVETSPPFGSVTHNFLNPSKAMQVCVQERRHPSHSSVWTSKRLPKHRAASSEIGAFFTRHIGTCKNVLTLVQLKPAMMGQGLCG